MRRSSAGVFSIVVFTLLAVSWGTAISYVNGLPARHGFDFFEGIPRSNDELPVSYRRKERQFPANIGLAQESFTADFTMAAIGFIEAWGRDFFANARGWKS